MLRCCFRSKSQTRCSFPKLQTGNIFRLTLEEMGHPQPPTRIYCNNSTAVGIANNTVKQQQSCLMEMRFFWVANAVKQGQFNIKYYPGKENLADYQSKHHLCAHHKAVRPWYLNEPTSVCKCPRTSKPSTLKRCNGTLQDGYQKLNPLPQVPTKQSVSTSKVRLPPYFILPIGIPTLCRIIGSTIARTHIPW